MFAAPLITRCRCDHISGTGGWHHHSCRGVQGLPAGSEVEVSLYRHPDEIENTIFAIGSHDITIDILAQFLAEKNRRLISANVGSMGGLVALSRGESHLAGSHLLDPETGQYNIKYITRNHP